MTDDRSHRPGPEADPAERADRPALRLDVRGYLCPIPARLSENAIQNLHPGDRLQILGDDPVMTIDIPAWCDDKGHRLLRCEKDEAGLVHCLVEKR